MSIIYKSGNMFNERAEAIVNTVNCVGVMGKGVALEFKKRWPNNFKEYKSLCDKGILKTGKMFVYDNGNMFDDREPRFLINFPTKKHWRSKSKLSYIEDGLDSFVEEITKLNIKSVALPPLGCGNGGLHWHDVKLLIEGKLTQLNDVQFIIFIPEVEVNNPEHEPSPAKMTAPRATLIKAIGEFETYFGGHLTRLSIQKIVYFLQVLKVDYNLSFSKNKNGPYSEDLNDALKVMERRSYIEGYSSSAREVIVPPAAFAEADDFLDNADSKKYNNAINALSRLIEGYESPFGMELLASVHYLYCEREISATNDFLEEFSKWNDHKKNSFGSREIDSAILRLSEDGLMQ